MANKYDLFELSLKRGLENAVEPWNEADWNDMETRLSLLKGAGTSGQSGFLGHFGLAAAILAGLAVVFVNPSQKTLDHHTESIAAEIFENDMNPYQDDSQDFMLSESNIEALSSGDSVEAEVSASTLETEDDLVEKNLTSSEKERILSINEKLQKAAKQSKEETHERQITTRYVGKDFDLGALRMFSPNNDGHKDVFMPSTLSASDLFILSITDDSGNLIYRTKTVDRPWSGKDTTGQEMPAGHYSWDVTLQKDGKKEIFRGVVRLDR